MLGWRGGSSDPGSGRRLNQVPQFPLCQGIRRGAPPSSIHDDPTGQLGRIALGLHVNPPRALHPPDRFPDGRNRFVLAIRQLSCIEVAGV